MRLLAELDGSEGDGSLPLVIPDGFHLSAESLLVGTDEVEFSDEFPLYDVRGGGNDAGVQTDCVDNIKVLRHDISDGGVRVVLLSILGFHELDAQVGGGTFKGEGDGLVLLCHGVSSRRPSGGVFGMV